jgi:ribosome-binding factor A
MSSHRVEKINQLLKTLLSDIIKRDLSLKAGILVSVSKVDTSRDLRYANAFLSVFPVQERDYVINTLKKEAGRIQKSIGKKTSFKNTPCLRFLADDTLEKTSKIETLLSRANQKLE